MLITNKKNIYFKLVINKIYLAFNLKKKSYKKIKLR